MQEGDLIAGRYRVVRWIASGGMGSVWEATDTVLDQPVALKHVTFAGLPRDAAEESRRRTLREARNAARLRNEQDIIAIYDVLDIDDGVWLVLEYLPSSTLGDLLDRTGRLDVREAARIGSVVASALAAAHRRGVVHRDVKPRNVLIADADGRVKLTDFGISHAEGDSRLTGTGQLSGTPAYMAREVAAGDDSSPASDVFSLASTLYRAVEGVAPFGEGGTPYGLVIRVATTAPRPPELAGPLAPLLMRMFDADPAARPDAHVVADRLREMSGRRDGNGAVRPWDPTVGVRVPTGPRRDGHVADDTGPRPPGGAPPTLVPPVPGAPPETGGSPRRALLVGAAALAVIALIVAAVLVGPTATGGDAPGPTSTPEASADGLPPVRQLSTPADAARPAGNGRATCPARTLAYAGALTGSNAALGVNIVNGAQLAVTEHNQANPACQVQLKRFDTTGVPDTAPGIVSQVVADQTVVGAVGLPFSGESKATGGLFQQAGLAHITPSATNPALTTYGWTTFLRGLGNDGTQSRAAVDLLRRLGATTVCLVQDDSDYGATVGRGVADALGPAAGSCRESVTTGQQDFTAVAGRIVAARPDAVFFSGYYPEAAGLDRQLVTGGFRGPFVAPDGAKDAAYVTAAGDAAENTYFLCPCAPGELVPDFAAAYRRANGGAEPGTYSLEAYDAATVLLTAIDSGVRDRAGLLSYLRGYDADGFTKRYRWSATGEPVSPPVHAYRVLDRQIVYVGTPTG